MQYISDDVLHMKIAGVFAQLLTFKFLSCMGDFDDYSFSSPQNWVSAWIFCSFSSQVKIDN